MRTLAKVAQGLSAMVLPAAMGVCFGSMALLTFMTLSVVKSPSEGMSLDFGKMATKESPVMVNFTEHDEYKQLNHEYDAVWDGLLTPNGGFLIVKDTTDTKHLYGLSMFHQLHCLAMIRSAFQGYSKSNSELASHASHHNNGVGHDESEADHWLHCFDYLRQVCPKIPL